MEPDPVPSVPVEALARLAAEQPDRVVLVDDQGSLTVGELAGWAAAVSENVPPGRTPVAVLVNRRVASIAACFGAPWAGRGVAPLDASEPRARLEEYLERLGSDVVLDATGEAGSRLAGLPVVDVTRVGRSNAAPRSVQLDDVSVLFFTSGSTGRPKAAGRTFAATNMQFELMSLLSGDDSEVSGAMLLPMNFVGGFGPVMHGCTIGRRMYLVDPSTVPVTELADLIDAVGARRLTLTPTLIRTLAGALQGRRLEGVTEVFGVGESTDWADIRALRGFVSRDVVYRTTYGASEIEGLVNAGTTVGPDVPIGLGRLPIGAMPGPERARLEPVDGADGVGELIVRGAVVAGYWGDPELTAERFGVDPDGVRTWRSGDLVRVDDDGIMHLCGRADDMIKVNGRLVEPAEAEGALRSVPGVRNVALVSRTLRSGRQQLVGHVEVDGAVEARAVHQMLNDRLPTHVVPGVLVRHLTLPTTQRGKVDRMALQALPIEPWRDVPAQRSLTAIESALVEILAEVLELGSVAIDDDLWQIGLDSLAAIELVEIVNTSLGGHLTPNDLMRATTPAALARLVTGRLAERDVTPLLLNAEGDREPVHFVCGAGGPAVQYRSLAKALGRDQPVALYEQTGLHRRWRRDRSVSGAASRHIAQIERLSPSGGVVVAGHSYGGVVANEMARRLAARGRDVRLVMIDPVDMGMVDGRLHRPVNLRVRSGSRAVHFLKLCWWRLHRLRRVLMLPGAPGSIRRYETFYQAGGRQVRQHRVIPFDGPTLLIRAGQGDPPLRWPTTLHMEVVTVSADHNGVVLPPAVDRTADAISRWLEPPEVAALSVSSRPTLSR